MRLAGAAPRHSRIHALEDVRGLHRCVRAKRQHRAVVEQRAPRVRVPAAASPVALSDIAITGGVNRLHGCDDPQASESRQVVRMEQLHMLDAMPGTQMS